MVKPYSDNLGRYWLSDKQTEQFIKSHGLGSHPTLTTHESEMLNASYAR